MNSNKTKGKKLRLPHLIATLRAAAMDADLPLAAVLRASASLLLAALLGGASCFGIRGPLALAFTAALPGLPSASAAALGSVLSALSRDPLPLAAASLFLSAARFLAVRLLAAAEEGVPLYRAFSKHLTGRTEPLPLRMTFAAAASMIVSALDSLAVGVFSVRRLAAVLAATAAAPLLTLAFATVTERPLARSPVRTVGSLLFAFAVTRALRDASGIPFAAETVLAFTLTVLSARPAEEKSHRRPDVTRILTATVTGFVCGLAADPSGAPVYAAAGMSAAFLFRFGAPAALFGGWLTAAAMIAASAGIAGFAAAIPEITVAAAILTPCLRFGLLPHRTEPTITEYSRAEAEEIALLQTSRADCGAARVRAMSESMDSLARMMESVSAKMRRPSVGRLKTLCDEALLAHCRECPHESLCWERDYAAVSDLLCRMTADLHRDGRISASLVPPSLAARCPHMAETIDEVNDGCAQAAEEARRHDRSDVLAEDFAVFSRILQHMSAETDADHEADPAAADAVRRAFTELALHPAAVTVYGKRVRRIVARDLDLNRVRVGGEEIAQAAARTLGVPFADPEYRIDGSAVTMTLQSRPCFHTVFGAASRAAGEQESADPARRRPNGDTVTSFETEDGRTYLLVCDGMGSGGEASVTSRMAAAFLEEILRGGAAMTDALTMLNHFLRSRSMECTAGVDLMELDRCTGEIRFVKSGAAPSFVVRGGRLFRLSSKTAPVGILRALDAEMITFTPEAGDIIVMLSDGVTGAADEAVWLCELLSTPAAMREDAGAIARRIVRAASADPSRRDDITAAVMKIA